VKEAHGNTKNIQFPNISNIDFFDNTKYSSTSYYSMPYKVRFEMEEKRRMGVFGRRGQIEDRIRNLTGFKDISGIEVAVLIRTVSNLYENMETKFSPQVDMSGPRWGILMHLWDNEKNGTKRSTPSDISKFQQVKKNTISSLLKRLEENGLIERQVAPEDKRSFNIRLTEKGRDLAERFSPKFALFQNALAGGLTVTEREELVNLLMKLFRSLLEKGPNQEMEQINIPANETLNEEGV
jgi:DNA-binding MarR family transcriptional regulator